MAKEEKQPAEGRGIFPKLADRFFGDHGDKAALKEKGSRKLRSNNRRRSSSRDNRGEKHAKKPHTLNEEKAEQVEATKEGKRGKIA